MSAKRIWVEAVLYGAGAHRRFTQDGPVLPDVWTEYLSTVADGLADRRLNLLIEPHLDSAPADIAARMKERIGEDRFAATQTVYNRTVISSWLRFRELILDIIPLTRWYAEIAKEKQPGQYGRRAKTRFDRRLPAGEEMWEDIVRSRKASYRYSKLLAFIRVAGLIAHFAKLSADKESAAAHSAVESDIEFLRSTNEEKSGLARARIAKVILDGWNAILDGALPEPMADRNGGQAPIYAVNRNRPVTFALNYSVKTVKGDAASRLFAVDCRGVTWAIIDSGIDATHPAFVDHAKLDANSKTNADRPKAVEALGELGRLKASRVVETYDFGYLEDLLMGREEVLPDRYSLKSRTMQALGLSEISDRIRKSRMIDWEVLAPFLRIEHDVNYLKFRPGDGHGTHVAGILGADWARASQERLQGMCPNIRLIDMRILRDDGTSSEFVVMSALQFLRYLNASSDRRQVHGANMSLSLQHDASTYACGQTPICEEAENTVSSGVVVVAAAGRNLGYRRFSAPDSEAFEQYNPVSITDPGNAELVITVGSTHRIEPYTYGVSYFSSRGPTGDGRIKPDLVAPGEKIFAPTLDNSAVRLDGTSMAAPHVSGAAAMLMARNVELIGDPARIKKILCGTASDLGRERYFQGHGLVDVLRALQSV